MLHGSYNRGHVTLVIASEPIKKRYSENQPKILAKTKSEAKNFSVELHSVGFTTASQSVIER